MYVVPVFITEILGNGGHFALVSMKAVTQMSPTKILALSTLPMSPMVASGLQYWRLVTTPIDWGLVPVLAQVLHSVRSWGRFCCCSPSWHLKVLCSGCWRSHVAYAPYPDSYSIWSGLNHSSVVWLWLLQAVSLLHLMLCLLVPLAIAGGIFIDISLTLVGSLLLGFLWYTFSPFDSCY